MIKINLPNNLFGKTILISGAAGFIPSHLAEFYLNLGATVIGIDNFITGSYSNIELLSKHTKFEFFEQNIYEGLPDFKNKKIDYIFSLASPASPVDFYRIPLEIMRVNSEGTFKLLELAREKGSRFLDASTSEVYGDPDVHPQTEDYIGRLNPIGPRSCYDVSKLFSESMTSSYALMHKLDTRIVRIFNIYGPRMRTDDGRVIPNFINQALLNKDITIYGDGSQTRSFCFVTDLVNSLHNVMFSEISTPFNIGNTDEYSIKDCAELIIKILNSKSRISYLPLPKDDPTRRKPDLSKLLSISEYKPLVGIKEGVIKTTEYFKDLLIN